MLDASFRVHPGTALLGPRQCGKTTLARQYGAGRECHHFDLENPVDLRRLEQPMQALQGLRGLVVLDEVQRRPDLFELLRVLLDRDPVPASFLLLGSASPHLIKGVSESLAGRVGFVDLAGFDCWETNSEDLRKLWVRGGFPRSFLAPDDESSVLWREGFLRTFLERDIPQFGITITADSMRRFWTMVAHYHGQLWNGSELGRSLGISESAIRHRLDVLTGTYMVRRLLPWHENLKKRQVKAPKVYVRDSGIVHQLLGMGGFTDLQSHPKLGASWEGFALESILARTQSRNAYFWATHAGAELDLLLFHKGKRIGFEFKYNDAPGMTKSLHSALQDLSLDHAWIVYPGTDRYHLHEKVEAIPLLACLNALEQTS
ncbi:MAG: ATP-binding protein [Luteolibacter sp.]|nr:ATP-binding protein [Luteolibacter sp.]